MRPFSLARYVAGLVLICCAIAPARTGGGGGSNRQLTANPTSLNFGNVYVGASGTLSVTATNIGSSNLNLRQATLTGSGFSLTGPSLPLSLGPGQSAVFNVSFIPTVAGTAKATLSLGSNASNSTIKVAVSGTGVTVSGTTGPGQLTPNPSSLNFGSVTVGTTSTLPLVISNAGTGSATISQDTLTGSGFSVSGLSVPMSLAPGQSVSMSVSFRPATVGSASGQIAIVSTASNSQLAVPLSASGSGTGQLSTNPAALNFGSVTVGTTTALPVIITNTGTASATISQDSLTGAGFRMSALPIPVSLAPGQSVSISVTFAPAAAGTASGQIAISGTAYNSPVTVSLSGTAVSSYGQLSSNPTSLNFGNVNVGASSTLAVAVSNTGTGSATISQASVTGSGFSVSGLASPVTLSPGQTTTFNVLFAPAAAGTATGSFSIASNATNSPTAVSLAGSGVAAYGQLTTNATTVNFGTLTVGTSNTAPVIVSNTGTGSATISQANVTGSSFSISGLPLPLTLSPGQNTSFSVIFSPTAAGAASGSVALVSNASNSPTAVSLTGSGANQHFVDLSWVASTSTVVGYNVYRSGTSAGPYTRINSSLEPATTYSDSKVQAGQTYYYATTAVDSTGNESPYSNAVQAIIPTP